MVSSSLLRGLIVIFFLFHRFARTFSSRFRFCTLKKAALLRDPIKE